MERVCVCGKKFEVSPSRPKIGKGIYCSKECSSKFQKKRVGLPLEPRFSNNIKKTEKCWEWTGNKTKSGYGTISINGKDLRVHRISWERTNGPIPTGFHICHKCDNPACVNPGHLFLGTHIDNMNDSLKKGRRPSILKKEDIPIIRKMYLDGKYQKEIGNLYGVSKGCIHDIISGKNWRHVQCPQE